jgi:flagellar P-ring protein precursor FlgI
MTAQGLRTRTVKHWLLAAVTLLACTQAHATKIQDLVRIQGSVENVVTGFGLVVGLDGTGDQDMPAAYRPLAHAIATRLDENITLDELMEGQSVALVYVSARVPAEGARVGSQVSDVNVAAVGQADLTGGVLVETVLFGPGGIDAETGEVIEPEAYAIAYGRLSVTDEERPTHAGLRGGAQMLRDIAPESIDSGGRLQLVINENNASWPLAVQLADAINGIFAADGPPIAVALDQRNVFVTLPEYQRDEPGPFISQILVTDIGQDLISASAVAKVIIDEDAGTISFSANVAIRPTSISIDTYSIALGLDEQGRPREATLQELIDAFQTLNLPVEDRISIVRQLHASGSLLADLVERN